MAELDLTCEIGSKSLKIDASDSAPLSVLIEKVLKRTGNTARPGSDWIVRFGASTLNHSLSLKAQGVGDGAALVFTLGPAESGT